VEAVAVNWLPVGEEGLKETESILKCKTKLEFMYILRIHGSVIGERDEKNAHAAECDVARGYRYGCSMDMFPKCGTTSLSSEHYTSVNSGEAQKSAIQVAVCHTHI
jgi:hypothetical protein